MNGAVLQSDLTWLIDGQIVLALLVLVAIALVVLAVKFCRMRLNGWLALAVVSLIALVMALLIHPADAHDHNRPHLDGWYQGLTSGKGPCCDGSDATHLADVDWESKAGNYRVRIEGEWHDVPPEAVLDGPNLDGRTLVWPIKGYGGLTIRCFMPGSMT